jgi:hypothetical protein
MASPQLYIHFYVFISELPIFLRQEIDTPPLHGFPSEGERPKLPA